MADCFKETDDKQCQAPKGLTLADLGDWVFTPAYARGGGGGGHGGGGHASGASGHGEGGSGAHSAETGGAKGAADSGPTGGRAGETNGSARSSSPWSLRYWFGGHSSGSSCSDQQAADGKCEKK